MAATQFTERFREESQDATFDVDNEALYGERKKGRARKRIGPNGGIINNDKWSMYDQVDLPGFVKFMKEQKGAPDSATLSLLPSHIMTAMANAGAIDRDPFDIEVPNYAIIDGALYALDKDIAFGNLQSWVLSAQTALVDHAKTDAVMPFTLPNDSDVYTWYCPTGSAVLTLAGNDHSPTYQRLADIRNTLVSLDYDKQNALDVAVSGAVHAQIISARSTIPRHRLKSRSSLLQTYYDQRDFTSNSGYFIKADEWNTWVLRNKKLINEIMTHAENTFIKHHGAEGAKTPEVAASVKHVNHVLGRGSGARLAQGLPGTAGGVMARSQVTWWRYDVTGWICALRWAIAIVQVAAIEELSADVVKTLTEYCFSRSTYRKLIASDATLSATRDLEASEVTQAATAPVRYTRQVHPVILVLDDLEFTVTRGEASAEQRQAYLAVLRRVVDSLGSEYANLNATQLRNPVAHRVERAVGGAEVTTGRMYGKLQLTATTVDVLPTIPSKADCVLLNVGPADIGSGLTSVRTRGENLVLARSVKDGVCYTYAMATQFKGRGTNALVSYLFGLHFREAVTQYPLPLMQFLSLFQTRYDPGDIDRVALLAEPYADPKSTQKHHRHVSLIGTLNLVGHAWAPCMDRMLTWPDVTNTFITATALAMASLPPELYVLMSCWNGWAECETMADYVKKSAELSTAMKALDNQITIGGGEIDLAPLFEWNVLNHRAVEAGWLQPEIIDRRDESQAIAVSLDEAEPEIEQLFREIAEILDRRTEVGKKSPIYRTWDEMYDNRVNSTPAGSAFTLHDRMLKAKRELKSIGVQDLTKTQVMGALGNDLTLEDMLGTKQQIIANTSWKREWSKNRALFAASMEHWLLASFALSTIEEHLPSDCPIGKAADAHSVCQRVMEMSTRGVVACLDGKNFNIFHRYDLMSRVPAVASRVLAHRLSEEQHRALSWMVEAELHQYVIVRDGDLDNQYFNKGVKEGWIHKHEVPDGTSVWLAETKVGMFSGIRFTMLYNTIFNRVYYRIAQKRAGIKSRALHSGDDVYAVFESFSDAHKMKAALFEINYVLQLAKCFVNGVREFLRISHKNANTTQYLARSAATLVHGRIETSAPTDFTEYAVSILRRGSELIVRHARKLVVLSVQVLQCAGASARWAVPSFTWEAFLMTPQVLGGIHSGPTQIPQWDGICVERSAETRGDVVAKLARMPGVRKAAEVVIDALGLQAYHGRASEAVAAAIAPKGNVHNYGLVARWMTKSDLEHLMTVRGKLRFITQSREYVLAKSAGLFNTLAINDEYWGNITGVLRGIPTAWHGYALNFALNKADEASEVTGAWAKHTLEVALKTEKYVSDLREAINKALGLGIRTSMIAQGGNLIKY